MLFAWLFAAALVLGLGAAPTLTYACPMQSAQTENNSGLVQLAMEDESSDESSDDEEEGDEEKSE